MADLKPVPSLTNHGTLGRVFQKALCASVSLAIRPVITLMIRVRSKCVNTLKVFEIMPVHSKGKISACYY